MAGPENWFYGKRAELSEEVLQAPALAPRPGAVSGVCQGPGVPHRPGLFQAQVPTHPVCDTSSVVDPDPGSGAVLTPYSGSGILFFRPDPKHIFLRAW